MAALQARSQRVVVGLCALVLLAGVTPQAGTSPVSLATPLPATASWIGESDHAGAIFGWSAFTAGDVNGDGYSDVVVGAPEYDSASQQNVGKVFVYHGSASGLAATPAWTMEGAQTGEQLGFAAGTAGDVNGDGFDDLIVSAVNHTEDQANEGIVHVFHGSASGLAAVPAWSAEGNQQFSAFGHSAATAGDVNSDGFADVVIGASLWDGAIEVDEGRAILYLGGPNGLLPIPAWTWQGHQSGARFGSSVAGAGDVDGDGFADVLVGAYLYSSGQFEEGRAWLFLAAGGGLSFPIWTSDGNQDFAWYGVRVATAGDTNGDGFSDILIGTWSSQNDQTQEGRAYVYLGSASGPSDTPVWVGEGNEEFSRFGSWVGTAGDLNGDGYADLVVGSFLGGAGDEGKAYAYLGSSSGPKTTAAWSATGSQPGGQFGMVVGTAGDVNGDGFSDVIIGAVAEDAPQTDEGRAHVYHGRAEMPATAEAWTIEGNQEYVGLGDHTVALADVTCDGYDDLIVGIPFKNSGSVVGAGRVELYLGGAGGLTATPAWSIDGTTTNLQLGTAVAGTDLDNDGCSDIAVSAPEFENGQIAEGQVRVYRGSPAGPGLLPAWVFEGNVADMRLGWALAAAGDVNGDGYGDLLVGSSRFSNGQSLEGHAAVYHGSAMGPGLSPAWSVESDQGGAWLGSAVTTAGDVNGDGYSDVIVAAVRYDSPENGEGKVWAYHGSAGGLSSVPAWTAEGNQTLAFFGAAVATAGDVNGDGYSDILVGAYNWGPSRQGASFLYLGSPGGLGATPAWTFEGGNVDDSTGYAVAGAGDLNADGYSDVLVGAPFLDDDQLEEGRAFAFLGSSGGLGTTPAWSVDGNQESAFLGRMVAGAADVNADGFPDILIGAAGYSNEQVDEGRIFLFPGNGGYGPPRLHRQARIFDTPIAPLGESDYAFGVRLGMQGRSAEGRGRVKMEWEIAALGVPLDGSGAMREPDYIPTNPPGPQGSIWPLQVAVGVWPPDWPHHWRMRVLGKSPLFPRSPWITPAFNGVQEADFRTPPPCVDLDADGFGNPGQVDCPLGPQPDCNDINAGVHPGAVELCDGFDNDCNLVTDDVPPIGPVDTLTEGHPSSTEVQFFWTHLGDDYRYDILRGDLGTLRSTGGDYAAATEACVIDDIPHGYAVSFNSGGPAVGSGYWFLIRATCGGVAGTYDSLSPGQVGSRDAEIDASGLACP